jgi:hypothetical protein
MNGVELIEAWRATLPEMPSDHPPKARTDQHGDTLPPEAFARLGTVRFRHPGQVMFLVYAPDGKTVASGHNPFPPGCNRCESAGRPDQSGVPAATSSRLTKVTMYLKVSGHRVFVGNHPDLALTLAATRADNCHLSQCS